MKGALLIVFVLTSEASQPETRAFTAAALEVLGAAAQVRLVAVPEDLADQKVVEQAKGAGADGAIELSWTEDRTRALVHCYVAEEQRWVDRSIGFDEGDDDRERGRMLGYAVASMFLTASEQESADETAPPGSLETKPSEIPPPEEPPPTFEAMPEDSGATSTADDSRAGANNWRGFDFGGMLSYGLGGDATTVGVTAAFRFVAVGPVWARLGAAGRSGEIAEAQANTRTFQGSVGVAWSLFDTGRFTSSLRGDLIGSWLEVGHLSSDDPEVARESRWLFGADSVATAGVRLSAGTSLFAGGGLEAMFGKTDIYTHGMKVATIPPLRLIVEFGLRSEF